MNSETKTNDGGPAERPILFSAPMVRAILDGRKTQTRRIVKHIPMLGDPSGWCAAAKAQEPGWVHIVGDYRRFCPYGEPGDRLWVREAWVRTDGMTSVPDTFYRASESAANAEQLGPWKSPLFMPRWASRITLEIESVRVERLQDISEEDAMAEGVVHRNSCWYATDDPKALPWMTASGAYINLWESINGAGSWDANPWVWVIQFRRIAP